MSGVNAVFLARTMKWLGCEFGERWVDTEAFHRFVAALAEAERIWRDEMSGVRPMEMPPEPPAEEEAPPATNQSEGGPYFQALWNRGTHRIDLTYRLFWNAIQRCQEEQAAGATDCEVRCLATNEIVWQSAGKS